MGNEKCKKTIHVAADVRKLTEGEQKGHKKRRIVVLLLLFLSLSGFAICYCKLRSGPNTNIEIDQECFKLSECSKVKSKRKAGDGLMLAKPIIQGRAEQVTEEEKESGLSTGLLGSECEPTEKQVTDESYNAGDSARRVAGEEKACQLSKGEDIASLCQGEEKDKVGSSCQEEQDSTVGVYQEKGGSGIKVLGRVKEKNGRKACLIAIKKKFRYLDRQFTFERFIENPVGSIKKLEENNIFRIVSIPKTLLIFIRRRVQNGESPARIFFEDYRHCDKRLGGYNKEKARRSFYEWVQTMKCKIENNEDRIEPENEGNFGLFLKGVLGDCFKGLLIKEAENTKREEHKTQQETAGKQAWVETTEKSRVALK